MSIINFICKKSQKEKIKRRVWEIIQNHYFNSIHPNSHEKYEHEGESVYRERLNALMEETLCKISDTAEGITIEFDSTEDAGFAIAQNVYKTGMGYNDDGLTELDPIFEEIIAYFPKICFEAETECVDKWVSERHHYVYDGEDLTMDEMYDEEEGVTAEPADHFLYGTPRLYSNIETFNTVCNTYTTGAAIDPEKPDRVMADLTVLELTDLNYTAVWTAATEETIAEAVAHGYPESMGAVAFMFVYKRFTDGLISDDLQALRAVVIQDNTNVCFAELCKDAFLKSNLHAFYLGVIGMHRYLRENNLYSDYASLNAKESGMLVSTKDEKIITEVVSGASLPKLDGDDRNAFGFSFF